MAATVIEAVCRAAGVPVPTTEFRFHPGRRWRFDFAWPDRKVALEVEGGAFAHGRHTRGAGFRNDLEKYNAATAAGWRVFRVLPEQVLSVGIELVKNALRA